MSEERAKEEEAKPVPAVAMPVKKVPAAKPMRRAAMPVKEMPKKVSPGTVKGKIAAIQKATDRIYSGARSIQSDAAKQMKENQEAVAAMQTNVKRLQTDIKGKTEVFQKAVVDIHSGVRAIQSAIMDHMKKHQDAVVALQSAILEQMKENQAYVRDFYG